MKLASRVQQLEPSPTLAITAKAKALKAAGEDVLSLAAGEPDFATPEHIRKAAVAAMEAGHTGYAPSAGVPALRDMIRQTYEKELGLSYTDDQVVVSCGAKHCLYNAFMSILDGDSQAIVQAPYWVSYPEQVRLSGAEPLIIPAPEAGVGLNIAGMQTAITPKTRAIILNSPCNPTGHVDSSEDLEAIAKLAIDNDLIVISDDIYDKLIFDGREFVSIVKLVPAMKDRTVVINGVSKSYAMTGWRLGYALGPPEIISAMRKIQDQSTSNATTFVQHAAIEALKSPPEIVQKMANAFEKRRNIVVELLNAIPGLECRKPAGTFYAFVKFAAVIGRELNGQKVESTLQLAEILLDQERVAVIPGEAFGAPGYLRLSFATSEDVLKEAVARIKRLIESLS
jgi:aspartate aminotransferase